MRSPCLLLLSLVLLASPGLAAPPANDDFADATVIDTLPFAATPVSNVEATAEPDEPLHGFGSAGHSVWFSLRLDAPADLEIDTIGSGFDTVLAVYTGSDLASLREVAFADDGAGLESRLFLRAEAGLVYRIAVDGFEDADVGDVALSVRELAANDDFAAARELALDLLSFRFRGFSTTTGYTREALEPWHAGAPGGRSAWFRWTAPAAGPISVETAGSGIDTLLGVYTGSQLGQLRLVAANDDALGAAQSQVGFVAQAGTTYFVAVDGVGGVGGPVAVTLETTAEVLIVDDAGDGETARFYDLLLPLLGLGTDVWDVRNGDPTARDLDRFATVFWASGESGPGPSASAEAALDAHIGYGRSPTPGSTSVQGLNRCLVISSQNYLDRGRTAFQSRIGVSSRRTAPAPTELFAQGWFEDFLESVPGTPTRFPLTLPFPNQSDAFLRTSGTESIVADASNRTYGSFRLAGLAPVSLFAFPLQGLPPEILAGALLGSSLGCGFNLLVPGGEGKLNGSRATFTWRTSDFLMSDLGVTGFWLYLGSGPGGRDLYDSGQLAPGARQVGVTGLPTDGRTIHATLFLQVGGLWFQVASQLEAADPPEILEPVDAQLPGTQETFSWAGATQGDAWWLYLGSTPGGSDLFDSGDIGARTHVAVSSLPTDGRDVYATLFHRAGNGWRKVERMFGAADLPVLAPELHVAVSGSSADFVFSPRTTPVAQWWLYVGSSPGASDVYDSGNVGGTARLRVGRLPVDGRTLHARLFHRASPTSAWQSVDHSFAAAQIAPPLPPAVIALEADGSRTRILWDARGTPVSEWWLYIGSAPGQADLFDSGNLGGRTDVSVELGGAAPRHLRLFYRNGAAAWQSLDTGGLFVGQRRSGVGGFAERSRGWGRGGSAR